MVEFKGSESIELPNENNIKKLEIKLEIGHVLSNGQESGKGTHEFQKGTKVMFYQGCRAQLIKTID
jgi:hypothetical protein